MEEGGKGVRQERGEEKGQASVERGRRREKDVRKEVEEEGEGYQRKNRGRGGKSVNQKRGEDG